MTSLLGAIVRGVRSRALLSFGSVVLAALALGSAVLGPIFSEAVTNSYVVTRLQEAPAASTGLARVFIPDAPTEPDVAVERATAASDALNRGPWGSGSATLQSEQYSALRGAVTFWSRDDVCAGLVIEGRCPSAPGEVLMLAGDVVKTGAKVGRPLETNIFEPAEIQGRYPRSPLAEVVVVGSYATPIEDDVWQYPLELRATNEQSTINGGYQPYKPAPLLTTTETMQTLGPEAWTVRVDTPLDVPADATPADLAQAVATAQTLKRTDDVEGGKLAGVEPIINNLKTLDAEVRTQQSTARKSIAPAVLSLVLVALALLMRLLTAASEIRVPELALASLRGVSSGRLWLLGLAEPLVVLAAAVPLGIGFGVGLAAVLTKQWLVPGLPLPMPWQSWVAAALVLVAAIAVACVAVGMVVRDTLASQLSGVRRPQQSRRWAVVAQLMLVALALAVLVSKLSSSGQSDPDLTDMVLPVLLAVVAGLAATRLTAAAATWWTRRRGMTKSLSGFVAARAISRRQEGTLVILPITAAVAVAVFGVGVYDSAATWRTSVAATVSPAATTWTSSLSMRETRDLTHRLDPEGEYLMAAASVLNPGASFAVVDAARLPTVATWPKTWSPGRTVEQVADDISLPGAVPQLVGRRLNITVDNQAQTSKDLSIEARFGSLGGIPERGYLGPFPAGESTRSVRLPASCLTGCPLEGLTLGGGAGTTMEMGGAARVLAIAVDGDVVEAAIDRAAWVPSADSGARSSISTIDSSGDTIDLTLDRSVGLAMARLTAGGIPLQRPAARGADVPDRAVDDLDDQNTSGAIPVDPVSTVEGMPFVGPAGLLVDYSSFVSDRVVYDNLFDTRVLMKDGAPESMSTALTEAGLTVETTLAAQQRMLDQSAYALALRLYAVVAALVLLMALAGLFVSTAVQLPARRRDAAALRVVGVARGSVMSAVAREFIVVLGGAAVAGILAGSLAQYVVLRTITLGTLDASSTPDLVATISPLRLIALALIAVVVLGVAAYISAALTVRGARGSTLRETAR
ncbi:MAG: FtsX-like permease family protein [Nocardioides sp.]|jgi:putative ABC transport system permease protein|uniref:FtsX-like permease family protein n=1 Tax=Nocardioides sp. TaxID=35761 RepID=UPI002632D380|nr:FtsX-like permease family protein [Nocardioides sp.]MCW2834392.1 FtsX-like permease family protein [Nocardioides sp.]